MTGVAGPNNINVVKVFPNPAKDHITIHFGNYTTMSGYTVKIVNALGKTVYASTITQQSTVIDLGSWTGRGVYVISITDVGGKLVESKEIVLE